jgi:three-Cys-motif partner protein
VERLRATSLTTSVSAIFCEATPEHYEALLNNLREAPLGIPLRPIHRVAAAKRGEASVLQADFRSCSGEIAQWLGNSYGLVLIDPWGAGMKMRDLAPLVGRKKVDTIILYPATDVKRFGSCANKSHSELTPNDRSNLTRLNDLFGDERWQAIFADEYLYRSDERESAALALYVKVLTEVDPTLIVKTIRLRNSAVDRTSYYLVLTTRNESGAIRMNSVLRSAEFREHFAVWADYEERDRKRAEDHGVLSLGLGDEFVPPPAPPPTEFPAEQVGDAIALRCGAGTLTLREIWRKLADDPFTEDEIRKGLRYLKERNQASFEKIRALRDTVTLRV